MGEEQKLDPVDAAMETVCDFAGHLAHELNNLLTPIIACGQMLVEGVPKDGPLAFCAEQVAEAGERCLALSRKLQMMGSRRTAGQAIDLAVLMRYALKDLVPAEGITVDSASVPASAAPVIIDGEHFIFMTHELIANAMQAMPHGGTVRVALEGVGPGEAGEGYGIVLSVVDQGAGMTPEVMARMYEPFFSTHGKLREKGLGLALVYGIVRRAGGRIACQSAPGEGTSFRIVLPVQDAAR